MTVFEYSEWNGKFILNAGMNKVVENLRMMVSEGMMQK